MEISGVNIKLTEYNHLIMFYLYKKKDTYPYWVEYNINENSFRYEFNSLPQIVEYVKENYGF